MTSFFELLKEGERALSIPEIEDPAGDSKALLRHAFNLTPTDLLLKRRDIANSTANITRFREWIAERKAGKPIAYITQTIGFRNHTYHIRSGVLIPRPETELIIDVLQEECSTANISPDLILELGVGSGVLSIESKLAFPNADVRGWDINPAAIALTQDNANNHHCKIILTQGDFFDELNLLTAQIRAAKSAYLLANPPYIRSEAIPHLPRQIRDFEPASALDGGPDGLDIYHKLISWSRSLPLTVIGEIGFDQKDALERALDRHSCPRYRFIKDLESIPRIVVFRYY